MTEEGFVLNYSSGFYSVSDGNSTTLCQLRGKIKKTPHTSDLITIGDQVEFEKFGDGNGIIDKILPRRNEIIRMVSGAKLEYKQILIANLDQALLVFSCAHPSPRLRMLDRFLVICEKQRVKPVIVANKTDLTGLDQAHHIFKTYETIGYQIIYTSASDQTGIEELKSLLKGKVTGLIGPSGVGKSSLINRVDSSLNLRTSNVSDFNNKGRHTTVMREMFPLAGGGFIADLPGVKTVALWDIQPEELDGYFPEISPLVSQCLYHDCSHRANEEGCAVQKAAKEGRIDPERLESYLRIRFPDEFAPEPDETNNNEEESK